MSESDRDKALEALAINRELERKDWVAAWLGNLAILDKEQGAYEQAVTGFEESIRLNNEVGNYRGAALQLDNLDDCYRMMGRHDDTRLALEHYEQALAIWRKQGNPELIKETENAIARVRGKINGG